MPRAASPPAPPPRTCTSAAPRPDPPVSSPEQDITPVRNPAHPARQPGRRPAPSPLSLSAHHPKITTRDPPLRELPHLPGIGPPGPCVKYSSRTDNATLLSSGERIDPCGVPVSVSSIRLSS